MIDYGIYHVGGLLQSNLSIVTSIQLSQLNLKNLQNRTCKPQNARLLPTVLKGQARFTG